MSWLFACSLAVLVYGLVVYPLSTALLGLLRRSRPVSSPAPSRVSVILAAHNEERHLAAKLSNLLAFADDFALLEIIVASDGSTDGTEGVVRSFGDAVTLLASPKRLGKTRVLDEAAKLATGEILVFCDASGTLRPGSLEALVDRFADPSVGCVGGYVSYARDGEGGAGFQAFKCLDRWMKQGESALGYVTAVSGAIHAIRRSLYRPTRPEATRDVVDAAQAVAAGYRCVYEPEAVLVEADRSISATHFDARVRMTVRGMSSAAEALRGLLASGHLLAIGLFLSHKVLRWWLWVPAGILILSGAALATDSAWHAALGLGQIVVGVMGGIGLLLREAPRAFSLPAFLLAQTAAMMVGTLAWWRGVTAPTWNADS